MRTVYSILVSKPLGIHSLQRSDPCGFDGTTDFHVSGPSLFHGRIDLQLEIVLKNPQSAPFPEAGSRLWAACLKSRYA
jgi:hypothetical protein